MTDIQKAFDETLQGSQLPDAGVDIVEASIDSLIDNDVLKEIPIVKTFVGLAQVGANIHDKLFLKKILSFLKGVGDIDENERNKMIEEIDSSKKYRLRVGEKLLYIIDTCNDYEGSERIAKLFSAFLRKKISYDQYLDASGVVARLSNGELKLFLESYDIYSMKDSAKELTHTGLVFTETEEIEVDLEKVTQDDWDDPEEHYNANVMGGEITIRPTLIGDTIYEVFGIGKEARREQMWQEREQQRAAKRKKMEASS